MAGRLLGARSTSCAWMSPDRQVEAVKLMVSTGNFTRSFAKALLLATEPEHRVSMHGRPILGLSQGKKVEMKRELKCLLNDCGVMESYGADMLSVLVASRYISKLTNNREVESYLGQNHLEILREFRMIGASVSFDVL